MTVSFGSILQAVYNYSRLQSANDRLMVQLSTGKRIPSPKDDPYLYRRIHAFEVESARYETYLNAIDEGSAVVSHVHDAVGLQLETLENMRDIANKVSAGGLSSSERSALNEQYEELTEQLKAIAEGTGFGGETYLDGTYSAAGSGYRIATGPGGEYYELTLPNTTAGDDGLDLEDTSVSSTGNANTAVGKLEDAIETLTGLRQRLGTGEFILESRAGLMESKQRELDLLVEKYQAVDPIRLAAELDRNKTLQQYTLAAIGASLDSRQRLVDYLFPR
ncbi:flagellin [Paenibacillus sp.]|uniref:flagellin n=1 Tax=Paenibacillus sp. TaxID=58172 RepID=UPI0028112684|nr:flagellin [Paenibacillus sp.]